MPDVEIIRPDWRAPPEVRALCTLRRGGVSVSPYESLNLAAHVGDAGAAVAENRRRLRERLRLPAEPHWLTQVHGAAVADLDAARHVTEADAALTRLPGRVCAVQVADCLPVLLAAAGGEAVAAVHCGWRGLAAGVLDATVAALAVAPRDLLAWLGPAIGPAAYEVGDEVRAACIARDQRCASAFVANSRGRWQCDLYEIARHRLIGLGVQRITGGGWCTAGDASRFFSHRRDGRSGRMAACIWLESRA